ncbi:cation efflux protein [Dichomitus squalens LYAD-421 SS1]|uniref:Cation efflux protein n=1 Tax=Dichomitus squalens TaxID=114155 RepID=A0A4Q9Q1S7_9APHY|nr:cation efflux protein [Dichomitus squalens LYAD-421 SS1]EJF64178.1 cation efflux protein [Dichomitus squalens LYAD-421 SS1]TBU60901.1 cation efflux protein [Dichomitus squalens]
MDSVDSRTRGKISLQSSGSASSSSVLPRRLLADVLLVIALNAGKDYLLTEVGVFWVLVRVLACGGLSVIIWFATAGQLHTKRVTEWSVMGMSSLLLFLRHAGLFTALYRLPSTRAILFTHFSPFWLKSLTTFASLKQASVVVLALSLSFLWDARFSPANFGDHLPGYGALIVEAVSSAALEHTESILSPSLGQPVATAISLLGACVFSLPLYMLRHILLGDSGHRIPSLASLAVLPCMAYIVLHFEPKASVSSNIAVTSPRYLTLSYIMTFSAAIIFGYLGFGHVPKLIDFVVPALLFYGVYPKPAQHSRGAGSFYASSSRLMRAYLKDILSNPESRKIFYFLMLNMCYMLVQMLYGIWTNSLGLISDAIHMAFDCMAIAVGLIASVMARWPPNERFTYGYGRIETLSGFANGIFLILISVFIVFEAIQRLLDPPEMNTSQLLLVSSLGLGVNLFGMFAMGGHHHGGHSHSHSHGHSHAPSVPPTPISSAHDQSHSHSHGHMHTEDHSHDHSHTEDYSHDHSHDHHHSHSHSVIADSESDIQTHPTPLSSPRSEHGHSHSASHIPSEPHSHSHTQPAHNHSHSHSHSHIEDTHAPLTSSESRSGVHSRHQSLEIKIDTPSHLHLHPAHARLQAENVISPITPNYKFGHDDHFETHHSSGHAPNLHDHSHVHDHAHEGHSDNMRGVFLHVMADTLGSVGVIVSTLLIQLYGWTGFDPIASLFIAILIAASVIPLVIDTGKVLALDLGTKEKSIREALTELKPIEGLASYSAPRFWPKDSSSTIGTIHIQLAHSASSLDPGGPHSSTRATVTRVDRVVERVDKLLRSRVPGLEELTIQVEDSSSHYAD